MSEQGLRAALARMRADGAYPAAITTFERFYKQVQDGYSGLIPEQAIEPLTSLPRLAELDDGRDQVQDAFAATVAIKLNGGLGTSMGMDRAKSLLPVKDGLSFLDISVRQVLATRRAAGVPLPLIFMNSFRTRDDTLAALAAYPDLAVEGLPLDFLQSREPKLRADDLTPVSWPEDPELEWCPPGHADVFPALWSSGLLDDLIAAGYRYAFVSNSDNLGATPHPAVPGWMAREQVPFVLESCERTPADRKGGHLALRRSDGRLVLRETAQTSEQDMAALQDLSRHRYCNTNNLWVDLAALRALLRSTDGALPLPLIRNAKTVDPAQSSSTPVIQIESAMGSAIEVFEGARSVHVERDRFVPVKTTNDLLVLRSDAYALTDDYRAVTTRPGRGDPFVDLDAHYYKLMADFDARFPDGPPSLAAVDKLVIRGDVTVDADARWEGDVLIEAGE